MSLGRLERARPAQPMSEINMTPLIDVMLVLLIIFMVAAPLMSAALKLELPSSGEAAQADQPPAAQQLALDAQGQLFWNGERVDPTALKPRLAALAAEQPEAEVQLAIDQAVPYGKVAALLDQLQAAKLTRLAFATAPKASAP
ncbi:ExbD/TolR family protein [Inhella sp.]|uniref:ExbD/TolR family protein n=1 Tax=Inhella sp. TaxID=1921806 RepID=UPI0035B2C4C7